MAYDADEGLDAHLGNMLELIALNRDFLPLATHSMSLIFIFSIPSACKKPCCRRHKGHSARKTRSGR
jgi:hypothetical protein